MTRISRGSHFTRGCTSVVLLTFLQCLLVVVLARGVTETHAQAQPGAELSDAPTYQGISILPGDVIDLHGGMFTTKGYQAHGHSAIYLGRDDATGQPMFLDFQLRSGDAKHSYGRIVSEEEFLRTSRENHHGSFDVFRLPGESVDKKKLFTAAKRVSTERWLLLNPLDPTNSFRRVCSTAVAEVLSDATGRRIAAPTPDAFESSPFERPPGLSGRTINIDVAIRGMRERSNPHTVPSHTNDDFAAFEAWERRAAPAAKGATEIEEQEKRHTADLLRQGRWEQFRVWAHWACMYVHPLHGADSSFEVREAEIEEDKILRKDLLTHFVVLPADEITAGLASDSHLSSCQVSTINTILAAPAPIDAKWLVDQMDYERAGGVAGAILRNFLARVSQGVKVGGTMLVTGITAPFVAIGEGLSAAGRGGSRTEGSHSAERDSDHADSHSGSITFHEGQAMHDLRGIASGGWH
jgi:hypothetical protein